MGTKHNEFEPDEIFNELNRKLASVSLGEPSPSFDYKEITHEDVSHRSCFQLWRDHQ